MNVSENVKFWLDSLLNFPKKVDAASAVVTHAQVTVTDRRSMRNENISAGRDLLPILQKWLAPGEIKRPIIKDRLPRRAPKLYAINDAT